jgi:hypothetical protein
MDGLVLISDSDSWLSQSVTQSFEDMDDSAMMAAHAPRGMESPRGDDESLVGIESILALLQGTSAVDFASWLFGASTA